MIDSGVAAVAVIETADVCEYPLQDAAVRSRFENFENPIKPILWGAKRLREKGRDIPAVSLGRCLSVPDEELMIARTV